MNALLFQLSMTALALQCCCLNCLTFVIGSVVKKYIHNSLLLEYWMQPLRTLPDKVHHIHTGE